MFEKNLEKALERGSSGFLLLGPVFGLIYIVLLPVIGIMTLLLAIPEIASAKKAPIIESSESCMGCHSQKGFEKKFRNNEKISIYVDLKEFHNTAHSQLKCNDCHATVSIEKHPGNAKIFESKRAFLQNAVKACSRCHTDEKLRIKPHHASITSRPNAPPCTECHGSHGVKRTADWKTVSAGNQYCLTCHSRSLSKTHTNGEQLSLHIDQSQLSASVHNRHACSDCHAEFSGASHPMKVFGSSREHSVAISDACRKCHQDKYSAVKKSIHFTLVSEGNLAAPVCTDCHGFHNVGPKATYDTLSGVPCRKCHQEVFGMYAKSVHGLARTNGEHRAPLCSSCHSAHDVTTADMTDRIRNACLGCHKGVETVYERWLPNAGLHLSAIGCAACHSPKSGRGISLKLYDENTGKPFTEEQIIKLLGADYQGFSERMNAHGEGIDSDGLWEMVRQLNAKGAEARVTFLGKMNVSRGAEAHMLSVKKDAVKECESCHTEGSEFFNSVTVAIVKADGSLKQFKARPEVLGSVLSLGTVKQFYVLGSTRMKVLDWIGILFVLGGISVPIAHIALRVLTIPIREARRMNKMRKGNRR